ncbi:single-pass membrane and coiled-coil domain-containing protein 1 [Grus japonensis]|uniref:Single-pass membrane and coiled-coil domain-containing protein 1 n=1 Tax=Grus japonensis TaxID=30415 RepID=A0ABC9X6P5_GRUJA
MAKAGISLRSLNETLNRVLNAVLFLKLLLLGFLRYHIVLSYYIVVLYLHRVETKLQTLEAQFTDLDSSLQKLAQKFELQAEMLEKEMSQNTPWTQAPEESHTRRCLSVEHTEHVGTESVPEVAFEGRGYTEKLTEWKVKVLMSY